MNSEFSLLVLKIAKLNRDLKDTEHEKNELKRKQAENDCKFHELLIKFENQDLLLVKLREDDDKDSAAINYWKKKYDK